MTIDGAVVPGLLFLLAEFVALAAIGYVIVRVALRETDDRVALAQGLVVGPAIWGVVVNLIMYALPGMPGAVAGWIFVLALAAVLIWRAPKPVRPRLRTAAVFVVATLALFWAALASRQLLTTPDASLHIGMAASIRTGVFPPEIPWNPGIPVPYHYGVDMLNGLLSPPSGPDLVFGKEFLDAFAWTCLALIVLTALLRRASGAALLAVAPLLLAAGAWTLDTSPDGILAVPVPAGIPAAGLRASLMEIYWPSTELPLASNYDLLPNIWNSSFTLSYALAFVVLTRATSSERRMWSDVLTLAALVGFLALTSSVLTPLVLLLWVGLEAIHAVKCGHPGSRLRTALARPACGLTLAAVLLVVANASLVRLATDLGPLQGLSSGWNEYVDGWRLLGTLDELPGGLGILGIGPLAVAAAAALLTREDRLVLALAVGTGLLLLASLSLNYEPTPWDITRIEGHARNFALFAFLIALGARLAAQRSMRWRYAACALITALVTWPTISTVVRNVSLAASSGVEVTSTPRRLEWSKGWFSDYSTPSDRVASYIRNYSAIDARVFSPAPHFMTYATGRSNASGFVGHLHLIPSDGPEYRDILNYLEPAAIRRLGIGYIHAPDAWRESLPAHTAARLDNPRLFELLLRDESDSLYRVLPELLSLNTPPTPGSYESLRRAVPSSTTVFLPEAFKSRPLTRSAHALRHARLLGAIHTRSLHLRTPWDVEPLGDHEPDLIVMPTQFVPWMLSPIARQPIWWNDETSVYALDGAVARIMPPPPWTEPLEFGVQVSDARAAGSRVTFMATFDNRAPDRWDGQDWLVIGIDGSRHGIPSKLLTDGRIPKDTTWFSGQLWPSRRAITLTYDFDFLARSMVYRYDRAEFTPAGASGGQLVRGNYLLVVRLRHEYKPNHRRDVAIIPVLRITVSETGEVSYQVHEDVGGVKPDR